MDAASQPLSLGGFVSFVFCFLFSSVPLSELHRRSHARAEVFFARRTGALLGKMSCQDAKLEIEDPDAYYAAHYAPPLGV